MKTIIIQHELNNPSRFVDRIIEYAERISIEMHIDIFIALALAEMYFIRVFGL